MLMSISFTANDFDQIRKMRLRYHRFDGIFVWKRGCLGNTSFQKLPPSCLFTSELPKIASTTIRISED